MKRQETTETTASGTTTASEASLGDSANEETPSGKDYNSCFYVPPPPKNVMRVYHNRKKTAYTDYPIDVEPGPVMTVIQLLATESNPTRGQVSKVAYAESDSTEDSNLADVLETPDVRGWVPLQIATRQRQTDAVAALLALGANPDCRDPATGCTPLIVAVTNGDVEIVRHLLNNGADVNVFSGLDNRNAFCEAVFARRADIIDMLLDFGARIDLVFPEVKEMYPEIEQAYSRYHLRKANKICQAAYMDWYWSMLMGLRWHMVMPAEIDEGQASKQLDFEAAPLTTQVA